MVLSNNYGKLIKKRVFPNTVLSKVRFLTLFLDKWVPIAGLS